MAQADPAASIVQRCIETITLLDAQLRHFPRHEQHGLCARLRNAAYDLYELIVEGQKRYHNKTTLTKLDVRHEQLRMLLNVAWELGYFHYHHHKRGNSDREALRRYTALSAKINELGAMIGGWLKSLRAAA